MYLTHFPINPRRQGAMKLVNSPQAMHAAVLAGFLDASPTEEGRVLWRRDTSAHAVSLLISSPRRPDLTHLVEQAGWPTTETWTTRSLHSVLSTLATGQRWRFRLSANPTKAGPAPEGGRGGVIPLRSVHDQEAWLLAQAARSGFRIPTNSIEALELAVSDRQTLRFQRGNQTVTLETARFDGILTVTDPQLFAKALGHGIGRAKGYGCGMLSIAPADG
jgi:CRISPR system Cascade subunit CasE